jgi:mycothiol synthase
VAVSGSDSKLGSKNGKAAGSDGDTAVAGLPAGYTLRRPAPADLDAVHTLVAADEVAACGRAFTTRDDLAADWQVPHFALERDAWVAVAPGGDVVGYAWVWGPAPTELLDSRFAVHPDLHASELEDELVGLIEERAAERAQNAPPTAHPSLAVDCDQHEQRRIDIFARRGFAEAREFCNMEIALDAGLAEPVWPEGIDVRSFVRGRDDAAAHAATEDAFAEHFRVAKESLDDWRAHYLDRPSLDFSLWFVAWDGDQIAGTVLANEEDEQGHVDVLAVGKPWRHRGLGMALLQQAFIALRERGWATAGLDVDAANTTGATRLYERAGMRVTHRFKIFTKDLPTGDYPA